MRREKKRRGRDGGTETGCQQHLRTQAQAQAQAHTDIHGRQTQTTLKSNTETHTKARESHTLNREN
eukprot:2149046-Rhodomonas_salina.1